MTATINRQTWKGEPKTGTDGSSQTWQNPWVDGYGSGFGPARSSASGFWTGLEPNRTVSPVQTRTAGGSPGPVANTTYTHHQNDTCVTLFAGAAVMLKPFTQHLAIDEKPRSTWERRRHVWEHLESQSCIQFVFSSVYPCIYIATHLPTLYLDWLRSAEYILPVTLSSSVTPVSPYNRCRSLKIYLIERVWDALGDWDWVNSGMHLEAMIEPVWRCNWRP